MVEAGICSFKLFMAYKGELMARDDVLAACMERARDLDALTMVHAENGDIVDLLVKRALAARRHVARSTTRSRGRSLWRPRPPGVPRRIAENVGAPLFVVHVTCAPPRPRSRRHNSAVGRLRVRPARST